MNMWDERNRNNRGNRLGWMMILSAAFMVWGMRDATTGQPDNRIVEEGNPALVSEIPEEGIFPSPAIEAIQPMTRKNIRGIQRASSPIVRPDGEAPPAQGLYGYIVTTEASHGMLYYGSSWIWQRPDLFESRNHAHSVREDVNTRRMVDRWLTPYLENAGAIVYNDRCWDEQINEVIVDIDAATAPHTFSGSWTQATATNAKGGKYLWVSSVASSVPSATFVVKATIPQAGYYGVTFWYPSLIDASTDTLVTVIDAAGFRHSYHIDQTRNTEQWSRIGRFYFEAGSNQSVIEIANSSVMPGRKTILDAVRLGGGMGTVKYGGTVSGQPRYLEAAIIWLQYYGVPSSVWNQGLIPEDYGTRFAFAKWTGADLHLRIHSNAMPTPGTASGSVRIIMGRTEAEKSRLDGIFTTMLQRIRASFDSTWKNAGLVGSYVRADAIPYCLLEIAFHDREIPDCRYLMDADFRHWAMRGAYEGTVNFLTNNTGVFLPEPPMNPWVHSRADGKVTVSWDAPTVGAAPTSYRIYASPHPHCFLDYTSVAAPAASVEIGPFTPGQPYYIQIRAINDGGISFPTKTLVAMVSSSPHPASVLIVNDFTRYDWDVDETENRPDLIAHHAKALAGAAPHLDRGLVIDSAVSSAVSLGRLSLTGYSMVDWMLGEDDSVEGTLNAAEQTILTAYRQGVGTLFISGSDLAYDLDNQGSVQDHAFFSDQLLSEFVSDNGNASQVSGVSGGLFDGLTLTLDNGSGDAYPLRSPDAISALSGASVGLLYNTGSLGAGVVSTSPSTTLFCLSFPFEAIQGSVERQAVMERALSTLAPTSIPASSWTLYY